MKLYLPQGLQGKQDCIHFASICRVISSRKDIPGYQLKDFSRLDCMVVNMDCVCWMMACPDDATDVSTSCSFERNA